MARSKKRRGQGRKRKALPRTPSGQLSRSKERRMIVRSQSENETRASLAELKSCRARGLGLTDEQANHHMSETIAGRMALRGLLTLAQAKAIDEYAKLVRRAAQVMAAPAGPRCSLSLSRGDGGKDDPEIYSRVMRCYNDAFGALRGAGERSNRAVNLVVRDFCDLPISEREYVGRGGQALARHFAFDEAMAA